MTWAAWWFFNDDRFLAREAKLRAVAAKRNPTGDISPPELRAQIAQSLLVALQDPYFDTRAAAVIALGKCGGPQAQSHIESLLDDEDLRVREAACLALGILGDEGAIPTLIGIMRNDKVSQNKLRLRTSDILPRTRAFAAIAIGLIGRRHRGMSDTKAVDALTKILDERSTTRTHLDLKVGSIIALGLMKSKESVPTLIDFLKDDSNRYQSRSSVATALGRIGDPRATELLIEMLKDKHKEVAQSAAMALGQLIDKDDKKRNLKLHHMCKVGRDVAARNYSIMSMALVGGEDNRNYIFELRKSSYFGRTFGALALGVYFYHHPDDGQKVEVAKTLHQAFKNTKSWDERGAYAVALGLMRYKPAGPDFMKALKKGGPASPRGYLCLALSFLGNDDAIPFLREFVKERGATDLRRNAALALGLLGQGANVETLLNEMKRSENGLAVLGAVTQGLGLIGDVAAVPKLIEMTTDRKTYRDNTRAFSAAALGLLGDKDDIPILFAIAENSNYITLTDVLDELLTIL